MKRFLSRLIALALALTLICAAAQAEVRATGNIWLRTGPGLSYDQIDSYPTGYSFQYLGETSVDDRGVAWYKVSTGKHTGWVSSRYSELRGETAAPAATPTPKPTAVPLPELTAAPVPDTWISFGGTLEPTQAPGAALELSVYYQADLKDSADAIGLTSYREVVSEVPNQYYNDAVLLAGYQSVENIVVAGAGYAVFGVTVGMSESEARARLDAAGLDFLSGMNGIVYEHRAQSNAGFVDENGHDSCINLWMQNGVVSEIDWSTYTG